MAPGEFSFIDVLRLTKLRERANCNSEFYTLSKKGK